MFGLNGNDLIIREFLKKRNENKNKKRNENKSKQNKRIY